MTKKKKVGKSEKRINQTAHQRAMTNPEAREALSALRANWSDLSPLQRGEQLNVLIGFECSQRGIAKELGEPPTNIRTYIKLANPPDAGGDWIETMQRTWAEDPQEESTMCTGNVACRFPPKIPATKRVDPVNNETRPAHDHVHISPPQQTKEITSPLSTGVKEPLVVNDAMSRQEDQVRENNPKTRLVDAYMNRERIRDNKIQRLAETQRRPIRSARSMKRQGRPEPITDPPRPVS